MKNVVVTGVSKVLIVLIVLVLLVAGAVAAFLTYGIRPFDRVKARINALTQSDPNKALEEYPHVFEEAVKQKMSPEDMGMLYLSYGQFLSKHCRFKEAIDACQRSIDYSANGWRGITKANAILEMAVCRCRLDFSGDRKSQKSDIEDLKEAAKLHPARETGDDKWFWPAYDQTLGRLYALNGDIENATKFLELSYDDYEKLNEPGYGQASRGMLIDSLVRAGKYSAANKKFIELIRELPAGEGYDYRYCFRTVLAQMDDRDPGLKSKTISLLNAAKYDELEKMASDFTAMKTPNANGWAHIDDYYQAIDSVEDGSFDVDWKARINKLEEWVKARPDSSTAKVALARQIISYGWKARGNGYADTVKEDGEKSFEERLEQAWQVLEPMKDRPAPWYRAAHMCGLGLSWEKGRYDAMVAECQKRYPDYYTIVFSKAYRLLPRWAGEPGEMESYITAESNRRKGADGDMLMARTIWYLDSKIDNVMNQTNLPWARVKNGMLATAKQYPDSLQAKGELSILAMEKGDAKTAAAAFDPKDDKK